MTVTKTSFPIAEIHQLVGGDPWPSGIFPGDIVDVVASLGHVGSTFETDGPGTFRFNVTEKVFGRQVIDWSAPHDVQPPGFYTRPVASGEVEIERTDIVTSGQHTISDITFKDFKVVALASGVRVTFR